ncbi:MAG: hypothetical protein WCP73_04040, partial [Eubacteriales bacterium]
MLQSFTRNYDDNSTEAGFQFTFYCDTCHDGFRSSFIESQTYKKGSMLRGFGRGAAALGSMFGGVASQVGYGLSRGEDVLSERFTGMSPEWQKEHEQAFERAKNEAMQHFHRCHGCHKYVCDSDYNDEEGLCTECAPLQNIAIAKARSEKMIKDIQEKADQTTVFKGNIEKKTTVCPACGKPTG